MSHELNPLWLKKLHVHYGKTKNQVTIQPEYVEHVKGRDVIVMGLIERVTGRIAADMIAEAKELNAEIKYYYGSHPRES